jgi:hypothetical protein
MTGAVISSKPRRRFAGCLAPPMLPEPCPRFSAVSSRRCTSCCGLRRRSRRRARGPSRDAPRNARTPGCSSGPSAWTTVTPTFKARWQTRSAHQQPLGRLLDARLSLQDLQGHSALAVRRPGLQTSSTSSDDSCLPLHPARDQPLRGRSRSHVHVAGGSLAGKDHSLISSTVGRAEAGWFSSA